MQLIYQGTTDRCLSKWVEFPDDWNVTCTANIGVTKKSNRAFGKIFPYLNKRKAELELPEEQKAMLIFDVFKVTEQVTKLGERLCDCACTEQHDWPIPTIGSEYKWSRERANF